MTIGILYNISPRTKYLAPGLDLSADSDIEATVRAVKAVFEKDNQVILIQISDHTYDWLRRKKPDVLFNICEGFGGDNRGEIYVAALLEQAGIPFTGSDFFTLALCMDKERTKEILSFNGVPTPKFQVFVTAGDPLDGRLRFPLIVKPAREDASLGIGPDSVVYDENALRKKAGSIIETFGQPAMAEEYVDGRELNISVIGNGEGAEVLPVSEIIFDIPPDRPKIVDYDAKWVKDSPMYTGTSGVCPAGLEESLLRKVGDTALKAYRVMGVRDYGRVDIRLKGDVPYVIEVNPNPGKYVDTGFIRSARAAGYSFEEICRKILNLTLERSGLPALSAGTAASAAAPAEEHTVGTDRVFAVRAGGEHVPLLARWFSDSRVSRFMNSPEELLTEDEIYEIILISRLHDRDLIFCEKATGSPFGFGAVYDVDAGSRSCEISFLIGEASAAGRGFGKELTCIMTEVCFTEFGVNSVFCSVIAENVACLKSLTAGGFREIGRRRQSHLLEGVYYDEILLDMTRKDWEERKHGSLS